MRRLLLALALLCCAPARAAGDFLEPEAAFRPSVRMIDRTHAEVRFDVADGYYMYRERFAFASPDARLGEAVLPPGKVRFDQAFGKQMETYRKAVAIAIPVSAAGPFTLTITSQGCADAGLCYSPVETTIRLDPALAPAASATASQSTPASGAARSLDATLAGGKLVAIVPLFLLLGLGLAFTPCVLPMVPILSSIIMADAGRLTRRRGLALSGAYSLGMALVYTALGIAAGLAGEGLAAALQTPWVLGAFALLLMALSLSMFGFYELQVPAALQGRMAAVSNRRAGGTLAGVFAMGAISALIVGPCVAAPLAGALLYISQTRDVLVGGAALFSLAAGMSVPLLLVGVSAGSLLPKAGAWMLETKALFGVLLLAMALWIAMPVLPHIAVMLGWAALGIGYGIYLLDRSRHWLPRAAAVALMVLGALQLSGAVSGGHDVRETRFQRIKTVAELDAAIAAAAGKPVLLDFYADWCVACKEMEKLTFRDRAVSERMSRAVLLQADVTANDMQDRALLKRFSLFGPPAIILFDGQGRELPAARVIGYQDAATFSRSLAALD